MSEFVEIIVPDFVNENSYQWNFQACDRDVAVLLIDHAPRQDSSENTKDIICKTVLITLDATVFIS